MKGGPVADSTGPYSHLLELVRSLASLVAHVRELLGRPDLNDSHGALLRVREGVRHEGIESFAARLPVEHRLEYRAASGRDSVRLHLLQHVLRIAVRIYPVEHGTNDVEVAVEVRTGVHDEETHPVAHLHPKWRVFVLA